MRVTLGSPSALLMPFKYVHLGGETKEELLQKLEYHRILLDDLVKERLHSAKFIVQSNMDIGLVEAEIAHLGFGDEPTTPQLWARILDLGHGLCPLEAPLRYLLAYAGSYAQDVRLFATERFLSSQGPPWVPEIFMQATEHGMMARSVAENYRWPLNGKITFKFCR